MRLLVNGLCRSRGPGSWPYHLQKLLGCELVNLSLANSCSLYQVQSTINELSKRQYDLLILMWPKFRFPTVKVHDISRFSDSTFTFQYSSAQNDWPEKIVYPFNDQDLVEKNWISGHVPDGSQCSVRKFFETYNQAVRFKVKTETDLLRIIVLQSWLKCRQQPYLFLHAEASPEYDNFPHLCSKIDWSAFHPGPNIRDISKMHDGKWEADRPGPIASPEGHTYYAELLAEYIKTKDPTYTTLGL